MTAGFLNFYHRLPPSMRSVAATLRGWYLRESQIIQERRDLVRVRVALAPGFAPDYESTIVARVRERMGNVRVVVEQVTEIPRTANGKLRAVTCELPAEERRALLRERSAVPA